MRETRKRGSHLIDCTRSLSLVSVVLGGFLVSIERTGTVPASDLRDTLVAEGEAAAREIARELTRSGHVTVAEQDYPAFLAAGEARGLLAAFAQAPPHSGEAVRGLAFVLPQDADEDGWPDLGAGGEALWDPAPRAFLCVPLEDGRDALVRRTQDDETILARDVVRLVFESRAHGAEELPHDAVRLRIALRRAGPDGVLHEVETERVVRLRNGAPRP